VTVSASTRGDRVLSAERAPSRTPADSRLQSSTTYPEGGGNGDSAKGLRVAALLEQAVAIPRPAEVLLQQARELIDPDMRSAVHRLSPLSRRVVEYHLGWSDAQGRPAQRSGKAIRPALTLLAAAAAGGSSGRALSGAVAVELVHNFSLLQDDVMDGDVERRNRPAAWAVFGASQALCASDSLLVLAAQVLAEQPGDGAREALVALLRATQEMVAGQAADVGSFADGAFGRDDYVALAEAKTGALMQGAAMIGALLAGADEGLVTDLGRFARELGVMFQAVDDILDIWGAPEAIGRPTGSDVRAKKASLPIVCGLEVDGALLGAPGGDCSTAETITRLNAAGAYESALAEAERHHRLALAWIRRATMPDAVRAELAALAAHVLGRALDCRASSCPDVNQQNPEKEQS